MNDLATIQLKDGRTLAYAERGMPDGVPLFHFHGSSSCRLEPQGADLSVPDRAGVRLISVDRPGCGESTRKRGRRVLDWAADVAQLADELGIERFGVSGWSAGGPHALACAFAMPERVLGVAVLSGCAPLKDAPGGRGALAPTERFLVSLSRWSPPLATGYWRIARRMARRNPNRLLAEMSKGVLCAPPDRAILASPIAAQMLENFLAAVRNGVGGIVDDFRAVSGDWGFAPEQIESPVRWLHGELDQTVPLTHGRWTADHIPNAELIVAPGEGHLLSAEQVVALWSGITKGRTTPALASPQ